MINQTDATNIVHPSATATAVPGPGIVGLGAPLPAARAVTLQFDDNALLSLLLGDHDRHLVRLEQGLGVRLACRGNRVAISGDPERVGAAQVALSGLYHRLERGESIRLGEIDAVIRLSEPDGRQAPTLHTPQSGAHHARAQSRDTRASSREGRPRDGGRVGNDGRDHDPREDGPRLPLSDLPAIRTKRGAVGPRSPGQTAYMETLAKYEMVFALGPAGTGKTYLAVAQAVAMLQSGQVDRIVLSRPAVEAGERLGFLPGDLKEKVDPYLRPLYDALHDMMPGEQVIRRMGTGEIEVAPLAFMRGRTLSHAFVILDEAQNTTPAQMKMVLTRMGEGTRMVITGDLTQVDLPSGMGSGLRDAIDTLEGIDGIGVTRFTSRDVVRHPLVGRIVDAYDHRSAAERESRSSELNASTARSRTAAPAPVSRTPGSRAVPSSRTGRAYMADPPDQAFGHGVPAPSDLPFADDAARAATSGPSAAENPDGTI